MLMSSVFLVSLTVWTGINQKKSELHPRKENIPGKTSEKGLKYCLSSANS